MPSTKKTLRAFAARSRSSSRSICVTDVFGLVGNDAVGERLVALGAERREASTCDGPITLLAVVAQEFALATELHAHAAYADEVGGRSERDRLDVLVDNLDLPRIRAQCGERREAERWIDRALRRQDAVDRPFETPEALGVLWIDQQKAHAGWTTRLAAGRMPVKAWKRHRRRRTAP
ncbi:MAG TPA: hypothetical protein VFK60_05955 [Casimicrobiaceae bacterium]|nr:hypothetical protein [Casimicrobiaceae bacterium]